MSSLVDDPLPNITLQALLVLTVTLLCRSIALLDELEYCRKTEKVPPLKFKVPPSISIVLTVEFPNPHYLK